MIFLPKKQVFFYKYHTSKKINKHNQSDKLVTHFYLFDIVINFILNSLFNTIQNN